DDRAGKTGLRADQVADAAGRIGAAIDCGADEVADGGVALANDRVTDRGRGRGGVAEIVDAAAAVGGGVAGDGAVEDRERPIATEDGAAEAFPVRPGSPSASIVVGRSTQAALGRVARQRAV